MRSVLVLASLLAAQTAARADSLTADAEPAAPAHTYIEPGVELGGLDGYLAAGATLEAGYLMPGTPLGFHAVVATGGVDELFSSDSNGTFQQARVGVDLRGCSESGVACMFLGLDVGVEHVAWSGTEDPLFCFDDTGCQGTYMSYDASHVIGVVRAGLDIGGSVVRWKPSVDIVGGGKGTGLLLTQSIALHF